MGQPYSAQVHEIGGVAPMKWVIASGSLPSGLTLNNQGVISGIPMTAGSYTFTVKVTDSNSLSSNKQLTLTVNGSSPSGSGSGQTPPPRPPISVSTTSDLAARVGQLYQLTLQATGGKAPYTWSVTGTLPTGLSLDANTGVISGIPSEPGAYQVTVQAKDSTGTTTHKKFTMDLLQPNQREVLWSGDVKNVPAIVQQEGTTFTTYMPIWYVMQLLKPMDIQSTCDGKTWHLTTPGQPNLSNMQVGTGSTGLYLNGTLVEKVNTVAETDPSTNHLTTYMPIWYVMQLLNRVGLQSTWNGTTWSVTK